jgi:two-component system, sensor histidine kinase PdtaS
VSERLSGPVAGQNRKEDTLRSAVASTVTVSDRLRGNQSSSRSSTLSFRLIVICTLAILPLMLLSVMLLRENQSQINRATLHGIEGLALKSLERQAGLLRSARDAARLLASQLTGQRHGLPETDCDELVDSSHDALPEAVLIAYMPLSGRMVCATNGESGDFANDPVFRDLTAKPEPTVVFYPDPSDSGVAIVAAGFPVFEYPGGAQSGVIVVSLPYNAVPLGNHTHGNTGWSPETLVTVTSSGHALNTEGEVVAFHDSLPAGVDWSETDFDIRRTAYLTDADGALRVLSVTPLGGGAAVVSIWREDRSTAALPVPAGPYLTAILTWIAALAAAGFGIRQFAVRHVRDLSRSMQAYRDTRQINPLPAIGSAPAEIRELTSVYEDLIATIGAEEEKLDSLRSEKDALLREVNHRSGNSLQIIASVMRMYRRETPDQALREILDGLINRVLVLSTTHSSLYTLAGHRHVPMERILQDVIRRLKTMHGLLEGSARKTLQPMELPSETAIPLALALAEILAVHFRSLPPGGKPELEIELREDLTGERAMVVTGPELREFCDEMSKGLTALPQKMLRQYAAQIGGKIRVTSDAGRQTVELLFPVIRRPIRD